MTLKFLGLFLFFFNFITAFAQTEGEDVVKLKDGQEVRGIIVEQHPGSFIKVLQIPSGDTVKIDSKLILTILKIVDNGHINEVQPDSLVVEKEVEDSILPLPLDPNRFNQRPIQVYLNLAKIQGDYAGVGYGMSIRKALNFNLSAGLGLSYFNGRINLPYQERKSVALFALINQHISVSSSGRLAFFYGLNLGYNLDFSDSYWDMEVSQNVTVSNGVYLHPNTGFRFNLTKNMGIAADIGYQYVRSGVIEDVTTIKLESRNWSSFIFRISLFF